jgi:hypothetical protein
MLFASKKCPVQQNTLGIYEYASPVSRRQHDAM